MAALLVGAGVGSEDGLDDGISVDDVGTDDEINVEEDVGTDDEFRVDEVDPDVEVDANGEVADVEPAWLADLVRDEE